MLRCWFHLNRDIWAELDVVAGRYRLAAIEVLRLISELGGVDGLPHVLRVGFP